MLDRYKIMCIFRYTIYYHQSTQNNTTAIPTVNLQRTVKEESCRCNVVTKLYILERYRPILELNQGNSVAILGQFDISIRIDFQREHHRVELVEQPGSVDAFENFQVRNGFVYMSNVASHFTRRVFPCGEH